MPERIVQCHGCFDLLHLGHIRHFEAARQAGDCLIVTITPDRFVNKGRYRPVFQDVQRAEAVRALRCVDEVRITNEPTAATAIREIRPTYFAKGPDYSVGHLHSAELAAMEEVGAELLITDTQKWSSTALIAQEALPAEARDYLASLRQKYTASEVKGWLYKTRALKVLVIGDAIQDEYVYVNSLGKSGKDPMPAVQQVSAETFAGGAYAVSEHVKSCTDAVRFVTGPVTVKRRFIERYPFQKLFEVYEMDEYKANDETPWLLEMLPDELAQADVVIVADYGHGLLTPDVIGLISHGAKYLAVNTQANAGNHGYNTISKYPRADFISLSERELRLDARDQQTPADTLGCHTSAKREATVLVTRGEKGCLAVDGDGRQFAPALTTHAVDRTGAGDAVFAVTACLAAVGMPLDLLTFMASVVGTQAVGIVGNARYIERAPLVAAVESYLS